MKTLTEGFKGLQIHAGENGGYMVLSIPDHPSQALRTLVGGTLDECLDFVRASICGHTEDQGPEPAKTRPKARAE